MRTDIELESEGATLRGWLFLPDGAGPHPAIVATAGFADVKETLLYRPYPEVFRDAGFAVLVYDHINFGESGGEPRQEADAMKQRRGYRDAITFLSAHPAVDADRIGIWGTSFSGGHVLAVAATDRRVKCVVSQVMGVSGRPRPLPNEAELQRSFAEDRLARARGAAPAMVQAFTDDSKTVELHASRPAEYSKNWRNEITLRSRDLNDEYPPGLLIDRISPTPLLMIVATRDAMAPTDDALAAYDRALEPKQLVLLDGDHYSAYEECFEQASHAARDWFMQHLR